jgi:nucleoside-diphosphate-sugar epimerase
MVGSEKEGQRIVFTGGSGVVGRHVIEKLLEYGHEILNIDLTPLENSDVHTLKADLTDGAQAFNSLSCHFSVTEPFLDPIQKPDAVVHFAGIYPNRLLVFEIKVTLRTYRHPTTPDCPRQRNLPH